MPHRDFAPVHRPRRRSAGRFVPLTILLPLVSAFAPGAGAGRFVRAEDENALLTLERIYGTREFSSRSVNARWLAEGDGYTTLEKATGPSGGRDIVRHDAETGEKTVLVSAEELVPTGASAPLDVEAYSWSKSGSRVLIYTNSKRVWRRNTRGDYWVLDRSSRELKQLGGDANPSTLMFAKFSPDGDRVAYVRENDIYVEEFREGSILRLTTSGAGGRINGTFDWVYEEELGLRDGFRWSPDGSAIAFWESDPDGVRRYPLVNTTDALYPSIQWIPYPKTGEVNSSVRVGVADVRTADTRWLEIPGDPRNHYIARMDWAGPDEIILQQLNRLQNANRVYLARRDSGSAREVFVDRDECWVEVVDDVHWIRGGAAFTWLSERDGWQHVYTVTRRAGEVELVTRGAYDVIRFVGVDEATESVYFLASPDNPTQAYLYRAGLDGTPAKRITPVDQSGTHHYELSPNGRWAIHVRSSFDEPPVTDLVRLPSHERVRTLEGNTELREKLDALTKTPTELFRIEIQDGVELDAWCIHPPEYQPESRYPLLVYVYGEPAGQTVLDRWSGSGMLWHRMLAQRGYVVVSIDNRGTPAPRGRAWRKSVYRQVGILAPKDQAAAVRKLLATRPFIDPERVAVWGWSGGGSMTLNAMFKFPDLYRVGMSVAPVPNQRFYDTIYQERYMGLPADNVDGYREGSAIHFAQHLEGDLLLVHGTGDDNCHYQGTEALVNELVRHNRPFTMMAYPNRRHSIREGVNTTIHLRSLLTQFLTTHLSPGPRPSTAREDASDHREASR